MSKNGQNEQKRTKKKQALVHPLFRTRGYSKPRPRDLQSLALPLSYTSGSRKNRLSSLVVTARTSSRPFKGGTEVKKKWQKVEVDGEGKWRWWSWVLGDASEWTIVDHVVHSGLLRRSWPRWDVQNNHSITETASRWSVENEIVCIHERPSNMKTPVTSLNIPKK